MKHPASGSSWGPRSSFLFGAPVVGREGAPVGFKGRRRPHLAGHDVLREEFGLLVEPEEAELLIRS